MTAGHSESYSIVTNFWHADILINDVNNRILAELKEETPPNPSGSPQCNVVSREYQLVSLRSCMAYRSGPLDTRMDLTHYEKESNPRSLVHGRRCRFFGEINTCHRSGTQAHCRDAGHAICAEFKFLSYLVVWQPELFHFLPTTVVVGKLQCHVRSDTHPSPTPATLPSSSPTRATRPSATLEASDQL